MAVITPLVEQHHSTMKPGEPQLNYCDRAVMVSQFCVMSLWAAFTVTDGDCLQYGMFDLIYQAVYTLTDCLLTPTKLYFVTFCSQLSFAGTS